MDDFAEYTVFIKRQIKQPEGILTYQSVYMPIQLHILSALEVLKND